MPAATLAASVLTNVGIVNATLEDALVQIFTAYPVSARGQIVLNLVNLLTNLEGDATWRCSHGLESAGGQQQCLQQQPHQRF